MGKKTNSESKANGATKRAAKPALTNQPGVRKAAAAPAKPAKVPVPKLKRATRKVAAKKPGFTTDDVALRAYFIAEKRRNLGQSGDEHNDWIEAERQLLAETKTAKKPARN